MVTRLDALLLDTISENIYKRDIYFFSRRERANLKGIREFFRDPEKFAALYYKQIIVKDSLKYVYPEKQPSFHKNSLCKRLTSDYRNYEIPFAVREKGILEIDSFREWFKHNDCEKLEIKEYIKKLQLRFPYVGAINPKSIDRKNSGIEEKINYSLNDLEFQIDRLLNDADMYFAENPNIRHLILRYQKWTFLAFTFEEIDNNGSGLTDTELKDFLLKYEETFKTPTKNLLIEYFRIKFNPDLEFDGLLLQKLGFNPCTHCMTGL